MMRVKQRYHEIFSLDLTEGKNATIPVYIPFNPDEMIVRSVSFITDMDPSAFTRVIAIYVDQLDAVIDVIADGTSHCPNTTFIIDKKVSGNWKIEIQDIFGNATTASKGDVSMVVEFIKYAD